MTKAALSSMEWRSKRILFARCATARRPKAPSRSWLRKAARRTIPFACPFTEVGARPAALRRVASGAWRVTNDMPAFEAHP
jgi:hypothetical protein